MRSSLHTKPIDDDVWSLFRYSICKEARSVRPYLKTMPLDIDWIPFSLRHRRWEASIRPSTYNANQGRRPIPLDTPLAKDPSVHSRLSRQIKMRYESTDNAIRLRVIPLSIRLRRGRLDLLVHTYTNTAIDGKWIIFLVSPSSIFSWMDCRFKRLSTIPSVTLA